MNDIKKKSRKINKSIRCQVRKSIGHHATDKGLNAGSHAISHPLTYAYFILKDRKSQQKYSNINFNMYNKDDFIEDFNNFDDWKTDIKHDIITPKISIKEKIELRSNSDARYEVYLHDSPRLSRPSKCNKNNHRKKNRKRRKLKLGCTPDTSKNATPRENRDQHKLAWFNTTCSIDFPEERRLI